MNFLAVALILSCGLHTTSSSVTLTRTTDSAKIVITATATWTEPQDIVCCNSSALYAKLLPPCPVRLASKCRARCQKNRYIDTWDGYVVGGVKKGIRIYLDSTFPDATTYVNGKMYIIDGTCPQAGRILARSIKEVK